MIETLVWNKTTGNLISGHQRLKILDKLEKGKDYLLTVAQVEMDEKTEKEQNIFMNNNRAQGYYDIELLKNIVPDIDPFAAGMWEDDIAMLGLEIDLMNQNEPDAVNALIAEFEQDKKIQMEIAKSQPKPETPSDPNSATKDTTKEATEYIKNWQKDEKKDLEVDTYFTITFSNQRDKYAFMKLIGEPDDTLYVKGEPFVKKFFSGVE